MSKVRAAICRNGKKDEFFNQHSRHRRLLIFVYNSTITPRHFPTIKGCQYHNPTLQLPFVAQYEQSAYDSPLSPIFYSQWNHQSSDRLKNTSLSPTFQSLQHQRSACDTSMTPTSFQQLQHFSTNNTPLHPEITLSEITAYFYLSDMQHKQLPPPPPPPCWTGYRKRRKMKQKGHQIPKEINSKKRKKHPMTSNGKQKRWKD